MTKRKPKPAAASNEIVICRPAPHPGQLQVIQERKRWNVLECGRRFGKALAIDTPIPTPTGWKTMGDLTVGELVFDEQGRPCTVTFATEIMHGRECFDVRFSDGASIVADADHQWLTETHACRKAERRFKGRLERRNFPAVVTTAQIRNTLTFGKRGDINHSVRLAQPLQYAAKPLQIDPYLLGLWLGDGTSAAGAISTVDEEVLASFASAGHVLKQNGPCTYTISTGRDNETRRIGGAYRANDSFQSNLRRLGVLGNKHAPRQYLEASADQRLALLQGLMDTDGTVSAGGACCFDNMNEGLADAVYELVMGLGIKATQYQKRAMLYGKFCGMCHRVAFTPPIAVFRIPRKLQRQRLGAVKQTQYHRYIVAVNPAPSVPVRCIQVDSSSHLYLAGRECIPTHNTVLGERLLVDEAQRGDPVAWFAPSYRYLLDTWDRLELLLRPLIIKANKTESQIKLRSGGVMDFWTLENEDAGRGRKYARVIIDEAGIVRNLQKIWQEAIRPTLTDLRGDAWFLFTPKGRNFAHQLFAKGEAKEPGWASWRFPSSYNPYLSKDEIEGAKKDLPPHVFAQEYEGIPADDGGNPFGIAAIRACLIPTVPASDPLWFGVDLAKSQDYTWVIGLDAEGRVCISERWQSDWGQTRRRVLDIIGTTPTLIDSTGVGDPIVEDLCRERPETIEGFKFTSQSKQQIMEGLAAAIQRKEVGIPEGPLQAELESFEYEYAASRVKYSAPAGLHDDGVMALALAVRKRTLPTQEGLPFTVWSAKTAPGAVETGRRVSYNEERQWT